MLDQEQLLDITPEEEDQLRKAGYKPFTPPGAPAARAAGPTPQAGGPPAQAPTGTIRDYLPAFRDEMDQRRLRMLGYTPLPPSPDETLPQEPAPTQQPSGRGWLGDIGSAVGRSGVRAIEGIGNQLGTVAELANAMGKPDLANKIETEAHKPLALGERWRRENAWLQPSKEEDKGWLRGGITGGVENVGESVTAGLPAVAAGAIIGGAIGTLVAPGPGTAAGAALGAKWGLFVGGSIAFGMSEYHSGLHEALAQGKDISTARQMASKSGSIEGVLEFFGNMALARGFGFFRPMGKAVTEVASTAVKDIFKQPLKRKAYNVATGLAGEVATEFVQEGWEAKVRKDIGMNAGTDEMGQPIEISPWHNAFAAIVPALTMSGIMGGGHSVVQRMNRRRNFSDLQNPEAAPADRFDAVSAVVADLVESDPKNRPMADMWAAAALGHIMRQEAIPLDTSILDMTTAELAAMASNAQTQATAEQRVGVVAFAAAREEELGRKRNLTPGEMAEHLWLRGAQGNPDILLKVYSADPATANAGGPVDLTGAANPPVPSVGAPAAQGAPPVAGASVDQTLPGGPVAGPQGNATANPTTDLVEPAETRDPLWDSVTQFVVQTGQATAEAVRKTFNIGLDRAGRLVNAVLLRLGQGAPEEGGAAAPAGTAPPAAAPPVAPAGPAETGRPAVVGGPAPPRVRKPKAPAAPVGGPAVVGGPAQPPVVAPPTPADTLPPPVDLTGTANPPQDKRARQVSLFRSSMQDFVGSAEPTALFGSFTGEALEMVAGESPLQLQADGLVEPDPETGHWRLTEEVRGPSPGVGIPPVEGMDTLPGTETIATEVSDAQGTGRGPEEGGGATGIEGGGAGPVRLRDDAEAGLETGAGEGQGAVQAPGQGVGETLPPGTAQVGPAAPTAGATLPGGTDLTRTGEAGPGGVPATGTGPTGVPAAGETGRPAVVGGPAQVRPEAPVVVGGPAPGKPDKGKLVPKRAEDGSVIWTTEPVEEPVVGGPAPPYGPKPRAETPEEGGKSRIEQDLEDISLEDLNALIFGSETDEAPAVTAAAPAETTEAPTGTPAAPPVYGPRKGPRTVEGGPAAAGPAAAEPRLAQAIENAAKLGVTGIDNAMKGLYELFGKPGSTTNVGVPIKINRQTYEAAKPYFEEAWRSFKAAGRTLAKYVEYMRGELKAVGRAAQEALQVYLTELKTGQPYQWEEQAETPPPAGDREVIGDDDQGVVGGPAPGKGKGGKGKASLKGVENTGTVYDPYQRTLDEDAKDGGKRAINKIVDRLARPKAFHLTPMEGATPGTVRYTTFIRKELKTFQEWVARTLAGHSRHRNYGFMDSITNWVLDKQESEDTQKERMAAFTEAAAKYLAVCDSINKAVAEAKDVNTAAAAIRAALYTDAENEVMSDLIHENRGMFYNIRSMVRESLVAQFAQGESEASVVIKPYDRIKNEALVRTGLPERRAEGQDATADQLMATFALEGVGYGQESYMTSEDRRKFTNWAFDSLYDMASIFKMPLKAMGWYGGLQLQFGNLGTASSKAAAFFMPKSMRNASKAGIVNLTKTQGDGTVAHELSHANDFNLRENTHYMPGAEEVYNAMMALRNRFNYVLDFEGVERWIRENFAPGSEKARKFSTSYQYRGLKGLKLMQKVVEEEFEGLSKVSSAFKKTAGQAGNSAYQTEETEMWARAFEAYVYDKLAEREAVNNFLVNDYAAEGMVSPENGYRGLIYPAGIERVQFNQAIDEFLDALDWGEDATQMTAYERGTLPHPTWKPGRENALAKMEAQMVEEKAKLMARLEEIYLSLYPGKQSADGLYWYAYKVTRRGINMQPSGYWAYDDKVATGEQADSGGVGAVAYPEQLHPDHLETFKFINFVHDVNDSKIYLKEGERDVERIDDGALEGTPTSDVPPVGGGGDAGTVGGPSGGAGAPGVGGAPNVGVAPGSGEGVGDDDVSDAPVGGGDAHPPGGQAAVHTGNFVFADLDAHRPDRSIPERFTANLAAIRVLKSLEAQNRQPTKDEKIAMSYYSGWGGMAEAFNQYTSTPAWRDRYDMLKEALTDSEMMTLWQQGDVEYYTSIDTYRAMWDSLVHMGFDGGRVLSPSAGIGNEFGSVSTALQGKVKFTGIEPSSVSFKIMKYLYNDKSSVMYNKTFEEVTLPGGRGYFDVVISNFPFSDSVPADKLYNKEALTLHNYMIRRALAHLRPGGIMAVLTTPRSMDGQKAQRMRELVQKEGGVLVAAFRLPKPFAQTKISPDILFIQKKGEGTYEQKRGWTERKEIPAKNQFAYPKTVPLNEWFTTEEDGQLVVNPDFFLGTVTEQTLNYGDKTIGVTLDPQNPPMEKMKAWVAKNIPANIMALKAKAEDQTELVAAPAEIVPGRYYDHESGDLHYKNYDGSSTKFEARRTVQIENPKKKTKGDKEPATVMMPEKEQIRRIRSFMKLRDGLRGLIRSEGDADAIKLWSEQLRAAYDAHVAAFGTVDATWEVYEEDDDAILCLVLENKDEETEEVTVNEELFTGAFLQKRQPPTSADTAADAMTMSLAWKGTVDLGYMAGLTGTSESELLAELGPLVFNDPEQGVVPADIYLSGNVKAKLAMARTVAQQDKAFERNVKALEAVIPADLTVNDFVPKLSGMWVPPAVLEQFASTLCDARATYGLSVSLQHSKDLGQWTMGWNSAYGRAATNRQMIQNAERDPKAVGTYGMRADGFNFYGLLLMSLNGQIPVIMYDNPVTMKREVHEEWTADARAKQLLIQDEFVRQARTDNDMATKLEEAYNRDVNHSVLWKPDGRHLTLPGKSLAVGLTRDPKTWKMLPLRVHQLNAVWRWIVKGSTYLAHNMGTGKTYTMIAMAMEARRLGLRKRPMLAVKNATLAQFGRDFKRLYPTAKVLLLHVSSNHADNQRQMAKVVAHDWDAIIVPHSQFQMIRLSPAREITMIEEEIQELTDYLLAAHITLGQGALGETAQDRMADLAKKLRDARARLQGFQQEMAEGQYPFLNFDEMGVDMLFVDEADTYKNIPFYTTYDARGMKMRGISGDGNEIALQYYWKTRYINQAHEGGLILASGTIINNSVTEIFNVQRVMQPALMRENGVHHFDAWAAAFGRIESDTQASPTGQSVESVTRFTKFQNTRALGGMLYQFLDTVTSEQAGVILPKLVTGKPITVNVEPNYLVKEYNELILRRLDDMQSDPAHAFWGVKHSRDGTITWQKQDIILRLIGEGELAAIDPRFVEPSAPAAAASKVPEVVKRVLHHYHNAPAQVTASAAALESGVATDEEGLTSEGASAVLNVLGAARAAGAEAKALEHLLHDETYVDPYSGNYNGVQIIFIDKGGDVQIPELDPAEVNQLPAALRELYAQRWALPAADRAGQFDIRQDLINQLVAAGIPRHEITTIWDQDKSGGSDREQAKRKVKFQNAMNRGKIRVLIASAKKGGIGYNFQRRVVAMHHMDIWWHYAMFLQALARGWRHGNLNKFLYDYVYVVPNTVDFFKWSVVAKKARTFDAIYSGELMVRDEWEDVSKESMTAAEIAATASGNPLLEERAVLDAEVIALNREYLAWLDNRRRAQIDLNSAEANIRAAEARAKSAAETKAALEAITGVRLFIGKEQKVFRLKDQGGEIKAALDQIEADQRPKLTASPADNANRVSIGTVGAVEKVDVAKGEKPAFTMLGTPSPMQLYLGHTFTQTRQISMGISHGQRDVQAVYSEIVSSVTQGPKGPEHHWELTTTGNLSRLITSRIDSMAERVLVETAEAEQIRKKIPVNQQIANSTFEKAARLREATARMEEIYVILSTASGGSMANPSQGALFSYFKPTYVFVDDFGTFTGWQTNTYGFGSDTIILADNPKNHRRVKRGNFPGSKINRPTNQTWELKTQWDAAQRRPFDRSKVVEPSAFWQTGGGLSTVIFFTDDVAVRAHDYTLIWEMTQGKKVVFTVAGKASTNTLVVEAWEELGEGKKPRLLAVVHAVTAQQALDSYNASLRPGAEQLEELPENIRSIFAALKEGRTLDELRELTGGGRRGAPGQPRVGPPPGLSRLAQAKWWKTLLERTHSGEYWPDIEQAGLDAAVRALLAGQQPTDEMLQEREVISAEEDDGDFNDDAGFATIDMLTFGLGGVVGDIVNGLPQLVELGAHALKAGATTFRQFTDQMRAWLGELYEKFKPLMLKAYAQAKRLVLETEGSVPLNPIAAMRNARAATTPAQVAAATEGQPGRDVTPADRAPFQYMGTMLYRPEQAHPLTSATNTVNPFDLGATRTATPTLANPMAGHGGLVRHVRGHKFFSRFLADIEDRDLRRWEELASLPWYIAKRHPEFRPFIDIELNREEEKQEMTIDLTRSPNRVREGELHELLKLSVEEAAAVGKAIVDSDKQNVLLSNAVLTNQYHLNGKQQAAYFAYWRAMQNAWKVKLAYANASIYWKYLDRPWMIPLSQWGGYREFKLDHRGKVEKDAQGQPMVVAVTEGALGRLRMSDLQLVVEGFMTEAEAIDRIPDQGSEDNQEKAEKAFRAAMKEVQAPSKKIRFFRRRWNKVKFYFPRVREQGDYVVRVWEGEGEDRKAIYSERVYNKLEAKKVIDRLKTQYDEDQIEALYAPVIPETLYGDLEEAAMERFITKVLGKMEHGDELTTEQAAMIQLGLFEGIADELNKRGFGMHAVSRRENVIEGYKTDDVQKIFKTYMSGLSGFLTKRKAAYEFYRALNAMGKMEKATKSPTPHMFEYSRRYSRDVLYNTDRLDMISAKLRAVAFAYYLAGNLKSAAVNFTQNYVVAIPELAKHTRSYGRAFAAYHRAMRDIRSDKTQKHRLSADEYAALHEVINKGVTTDQYVREITARGEGAGEVYDKLIHAVALPFRWVEIKNRQAAFLAAYRTFMRQGLGHKASVERGKTYVYDSHFLYGRANLPQAARGPTVGSKVVRTAYTFRSYTHSFLLGMMDNLTGLPGGRRNVRTVAQSLAALLILGGLPAEPWLDDILDIMERWLGYPVRAKMYAWLEGTGGEMLREFGESGLPGVVAGIDLSGSLKIGLPLFTARGTQETVYGVYGGLYDKGARAFEAIAAHDPMRAFEEAAPSFVSNVLRAKREYEKPVTTATGRVKLDERGKPLKLSAGEAVSRAVGFRQAREAHASMEMRSFTNLTTAKADERHHLRSRWIAAETPAERAEVLRAVQQYNRGVLQYRGAVPRITMESLRKAKQTKPTKPYLRYQRLLDAGQ